MRLTDVGKAVKAYAMSAPGVMDRMLAKLGSKLAPVLPWHPISVHGNTRVTFQTETPRPATYPAKLKITATFTCESCKNPVSHEYDMIWEDDRWYDIEVPCFCGAVWRHLRGHDMTLDRLNG